MACAYAIVVSLVRQFGSCVYCECFSALMLIIIGYVILGYKTAHL
jgi:hypothetical protein